ncbi:hypothetical protein [Flavihumibacter petaseus]|uniref:Uncharacterized protein n=1 Tax=Flavihumibacter petaseus NBRC 106054 TaxID=1220578 RepID=A0A0E9MVI1_9BACT|nr:hypothetical protein [Flavihumibacter petaseus]GAO41767.1 hypothetical protein FPE01S_01_07810 [Flavihumibacter petaseus NBRC 106054]
MSKGIDISIVKETYQRMSDEELVRAATREAHGLMPEAMEVVRSEIQRRGLGEGIERGIAAQNRTYSVEEIDAFCDILSRLECPTCGDSKGRLNATLTAEAFSMILATTYDRKISVGCPRCLDKANNRALIKSVIFGWWGIPWGLIRTGQAIAVNVDSKQKNHSPGHTNYFRSFVFRAIGELEAFKDNPDKLKQIAARQSVV